MSKIIGSFSIKLGRIQAAKEVFEDRDPNLCSDIPTTVLQGPDREEVLELFSIDDLDHDPSHEEIEAEYASLGLERSRKENAIRFANQYREQPSREIRQEITFYLQTKDFQSSQFGICPAVTLWRDDTGNGRRLDKSGHNDCGPRHNGKNYRWNRKGVLFAGVRKP